MLRALRVVLILACCVMAGVLLWRRPGAAGVPGMFSEGLTLAGAIERSRAEGGRPVLAVVTADWCGPCQALKRGALRDDRVAGLVAKRALPVYIEVDRSPDEARQLAPRFLPAIIVLKGEREVGRLEGAHDAGMLLEWLTAAFDHAAASGPTPAGS